jgi:hypothetical protein
MQAINFTISETTRGINYDFGLEQILYSIRFSNIFASFNEAVEEIYQMFVQMVITFTNKMKKNDKIRIVFFHESIFTCIDLPFVLRDDFTASLIMNAFEAVMQSYQIQYLNIGPKKDKFIYILFFHSHYNVITNMATYLDISYYCNHCNVNYSNNITHSCSDLCSTCKKAGCN